MELTIRNTSRIPVEATNEITVKYDPKEKKEPEKLSPANNSNMIKQKPLKQANFKII